MGLLKTVVFCPPPLAEFSRNYFSGLIFDYFVGESGVGVEVRRGLIRIGLVLTAIVSLEPGRGTAQIRDGVADRRSLFGR